MALGNNRLQNLSNQSINNKLVLPKRKYPEIPEKVAKAFPDMKVWLGELQRMDDEWIVRAAIAIRGGAS